MDKNAEHLKGQETPTAEQVAWVFAHLQDHMMEPGSFRHLIYDRLGFSCGAYSPLYLAGGMTISNAFIELSELSSKKHNGN